MTVNSRVMTEAEQTSMTTQTPGSQQLSMEELDNIEGAGLLGALFCGAVGAVAGAAVGATMSAVGGADLTAVGYAALGGAAEGGIDGAFVGAEMPEP